jgi:hypothetical protein
MPRRHNYPTNRQGLDSPLTKSPDEFLWRPFAEQPFFTSNRLVKQCTILSYNPVKKFKMRIDFL